MSTVLSDDICKARKVYRCDASQVFQEQRPGPQELNDADWSIVAAAEAEGFLVAPGQRYRRVVYLDCGELRTFRARLDMDELMLRNELYAEE